LMISENRFFTSSGNKYYKDGSYIIGTWAFLNKLIKKSNSNYW
jgi:hypothetical protein